MKNRHHRIAERLQALKDIRSRSEHFFEALLQEVSSLRVHQRRLNATSGRALGGFDVNDFERGSVWECGCKHAQTAVAMLREKCRAARQDWVVVAFISLAGVIRSGKRDRVLRDQASPFLASSLRLVVTAASRILCWWRLGGGSVQRFKTTGNNGRRIKGRIVPKAAK